MPNVDVSMAARQYLSAGWSLVPIAKGSKGPRHVGWNLKTHCVEDERQVGRIKSGVGLAHLYSRTACIDFDDLARARDWLLDEHVVNVDRLLDAPDAVQILSGRENRAKLLYRLPDDVDSLITVKIPDCNLELRCGTRDGKTVQDVLPPTIHPDTLLPYKWAGGGRWESLPVLPPEVLEVWRLLEQGVEPARPAAGVADGDPEADPVVLHLEAAGWVKGREKDGTRHIRCPFCEGHTGGGAKDKPKDTSYFPAATGGYANGHFNCLHTTCEGRTDDEFLDAIGFDRHAVVAEQFEVIESTPEETAARERMATLERDKHMRPKATANNLATCLAPEVCGWHLAKDTFRDAVMWSADGRQNWVAFKDADYFELRLRLEAAPVRMLPIGQELIRAAVDHTAEKRQFDSAQTWLGRLQWDGVPRVRDFLTVYFGAEASSYAQAVAEYLWTAMAGRVMQPGVKADMVPILVGDQGLGKSTGIMALVPAPEHYVEIDFGAKEEDLARKMRGALVAEFAELKGLRGREIEHVKAFITRQYENWTPKFKEFNQTYPRRCVFFGTTNTDEFLADETGNRRWLPVRVAQVGVDQITRDRDQLWAEAAVLFRANGVMWQNAQRLALEVHADHLITDPWELAIHEWLNGCEGFEEVPRRKAGVSVNSILSDVLDIKAKDRTRAFEMRVSGILRKIGMKKEKRRVNGIPTWVYFHGDVPTCSNLVPTSVGTVFD
jgi:hypothetical protein